MWEYQKTRQYMRNRICSLRRQAHLTQAQLSSMLGISRRTYANYERGVHAMPVEILVRIAEIFHTSLDYLTGRDWEGSQPDTANVAGNTQKTHHPEQKEYPECRTLPLQAV